MKSKFINNQRKFIESYKKIGPYLGLGTQLAATVILMVFLGIWVDRQFSSYPIFIIFFSVLGMFAGIYNFIRSVTKLSDKKKE